MHALDTFYAKRWFVAFIAITLLCAIALIALYSLFPLKTFIPLVVHHNVQTHEVWVKAPAHVPKLDAEMQADIVRYITTRESYSAHDIEERFHLTKLLSNEETAKHYADEQANTNPDAPINQLGEKGSRRVDIEDIVFLHNRQAKHPAYLAKVDFTSTTTNESGTAQTMAWVATIAWDYHGVPKNQLDAWENWNGFSVTYYRVDARQLKMH